MKQQASFEYEGRKYILVGVSFWEWWREDCPVRLPDKTCLMPKWSGQPPMPTNFEVLSEHPYLWYEARLG